MLIKILFNKIHYIENEKIISIDNIIYIGLQPSSIDIQYWNYVLKNQSERSYLINLGIKQANDFNNKKFYYIDISNSVIDNSNIIIDMSD